MYSSCLSFISYKRFFTNEVNVGNMGIGGKNPVRIQTMTNTKTQDIDATVSQIRKIYEAGSELVRLAIPSEEDVPAIQRIKKIIRNDGIQIPFIADIHFNPSLAEAVAPFVEKVRINPGNYVNRSKSAKAKIYSQPEEQEELEQIRQRLKPLLQLCKENGTAIRIGINFASLSWRIVNTYGNTPKAMVTSAMEFLEICRLENFHQVIISLKASDIHNTLYANRLFVEQMNAQDWHYPIHIGVTEAGLDMDGRIKSAVGIGSLLCDGIGDTVRVSLTESPEKEIPVAQAIVQQIKNFTSDNIIVNNWKHNPFQYQKRKSKAFKNLIGDNIPVPYLVQSPSHKIPEAWNEIYQHSCFENPLTFEVYGIKATLNQSLFEIRQKIYTAVETGKPLFLEIETKNSVEESAIPFSLITGNLFAEGLIDGISVKCDDRDYESCLSMLKSMLQITGARRTGNEYISCPSCSRTQFDIETVAREVKAATIQFKGLKIAVMGCVVNGPGEMQDADYGYIGSGKETITLYKKGVPVVRNIAQADAIKVLVELIKKEY
jgi:(E)-4-hydroxy-3-methylbut-2-enyl-diphosphate synthase